MESSSGDVLACVLARFSLMRDPKPLPTNETEAREAYVRRWNPGEWKKSD